MNIPENIANFLGERALLIVTGSSVGKFYAVSGGVVSEVAAISVLPPRDLQGQSFFSRQLNKKRGSALSTIKNQLLRVPFLREIEKSLLAVLRKGAYTSIYIFSPDGLAKHIAELVPRQLKNTVRPAFTGNFARFNPLHLLRKIKIRHEGTLTS